MSCIADQTVKSLTGEKQVETKPCELYHRTAKKTLPTQLTESRAMEQKEQRHNWNINFSSMAMLALRASGAKR